MNFLQLRVIPAAMTAILTLAPSGALAQRLFKTPEEAADSLNEAAKKGDSGHLLRVLGKSAGDIISSGDPAADKTARETFVQGYAARHAVTQEDDHKAVVTIGENDWPFPIPIVRNKEGWHFDIAQGRQELLSRRIGRNEIDAQQVALAVADAQNDYADLSRKERGLPIYAQRILSTPGKKDGLYWPTREDESPSPLGDLIARASSEGYKKGKGHQPYHGYYYKILTRQGPAAEGGAFDYIVRGKMIGGFALVAYPATYRNSGVMTFIVNHQGVLYEKDLGPDTAKLAPKIAEFNPDKTWRPVESPTETATR